MELEWNLRDELLRVTQRWPLLLLFFAIGSLLGWGISYLMPFSYRSEASLSVAYNADAIFRNVDDFKNWEMGQLTAVIYSDDILKQTLENLVSEDAAWKGLTPADIRLDLHVYWRNAGEWRLVAQSPHPKKATQLVQAWKMAILERVGDALQNSAHWLEVNSKIQAASYIQLDQNRRLLEIEQIGQGLQAWLDENPADSQAHGIDLQPRWRLYYFASRLVEQDQVTRKLLEQFPSESGTMNEYREWVKMAQTAIDEERILIQKRLPELEAQIQALTQQSVEVSNQSYLLSAYIQVASLDETITPPKAIRSHPLAALAGGILGLIGGITIWLAIPARRKA